VVCLLASGCAQDRLLARRGGSKASHVARSQTAPRPAIFRTAYNDGGRDQGLASYEGSCNSGSCYQGGQGSSACQTCQENGRGGVCENCGGRGCGLCSQRRGGAGGGFCPHQGGYPEYPAFNPGPPTGQVAYPYYTVRGPRDFLQSNPPSIGPY